MKESRNIEDAGWPETEGATLGDEFRFDRERLGKSLLDIERELRIKAGHLAAIEDGRPEAFPNPGLVPGFVRSYSRHLRRDPEADVRRFCRETGFVPAGAAHGVPSRRREAKTAAPAGFPLAEPRRRLPELPLAGIGSMAVLLGLIGGLGYGGWTLLQNIQRVQFAPVEEAPVALAEAPEPASPDAVPVADAPGLAAPVAATELVELYRQQELEVPILVPRDGPIAALDPERTGLLARAARPETAVVASIGGLGLGGDEAAPAAVAGEPQVVAAEARPGLSVVAERPAWIRVYYPSGSVIFERILESGEVYEVPDTEEAPLLWAGNSGSVYVRIDGALHGPVGRGTRASRDVPLEATALSERFAPVQDVPAVLADAAEAPPAATEVLVQ
jgi:cytoskeleton protein RodZ